MIAALERLRSLQEEQVRLPERVAAFGIAGGGAGCRRPAGEIWDNGNSLIPNPVP
jgi:hypothetical protein